MINHFINNEDDFEKAYNDIETQQNNDEIEDYDEELCCILSETVYLLYHDILSVNTAPTKPEETYEPVPEEPELPFLPF